MIDTKSNQHYPWKRFWVERGELPTLDDAYLYDPDSEYAWAYSTNAKPLTKLSDKQVLILLGEAGMGKSQALLDDYELHHAQTKSAGNQNLYINLNEFGLGDQDRLKSTLFDSTHFRKYKEGANLHLFLDSFDECHTLIQNLPQWLMAQLKASITDPNRFFLRIACRTSVWPQHLEEDLRQVWDTEMVGVYEICPLRRSDVLVAANTEEIEGSDFLEQIDNAEVGSLACRPVTLRLLLKLALQKEGMPSEKTELYEQGLRALSEENNPYRRKKILLNTSEQRFVIASKIAAALFLCNQSALWLGPAHEAPDGDVIIADITGVEIEDTGQWSIEESTLREMLEISGLFSSRGANRIGFAHQSFGEFLTARYLHRHSDNLDQKLRLLRHTEKGPIIPALGEIAAWLATMDRNVFNNLMGNEPVLLLNVDGSSLSNVDKEKLVSTLLHTIDQDKIFVHDLNNNQLRKLAHPALSAQISPIIVDKRRSIAIREFSIKLASYCQVQSVVDILIDIALSSDEDKELRYSAISSSIIKSNNSRLERLRSLALNDGINKEVDYKLQYKALELLWPKYISANEFFHNPFPESIDTYISDFSISSGDFGSTLETKHLPDALDWVKRNASRDDRDYTCEVLIDIIMRKAWSQLKEPGILTSFTDAVQELIKNYVPIFHQRGARKDKDDPLSDTNKRHTFLIHIIYSMDPDKINNLVSVTDNFAQTQDIHWLFDQYNSSLPEKARKNIAQLINVLLRYDSPIEIVNKILDLCSIDAKPTDLVLRKVFNWLTHPMRLKSKTTQKFRNNWFNDKKRREQHAKGNKLLSPPPQERVDLALVALEAGNLKSWTNLANEMTLEDNSRHYSFPHKLYTSPGWLSASPDVRQRILSAALDYVLKATPIAQDMLERSEHNSAEFAPAFALELLAKESPKSLAILTSERWAIWSEVLLAYLFNDSKLRETLYCMAHKNAPETFLAGIIKVIDRRIRNDIGVYNLSDFDCVWNPALASVLIEKFEDPNVPLQSQNTILEYLLKHNEPTVLQHAMARLEQPTDSAQLKATAICLLNWNAGTVWKKISKVIESDIDLGKEIMLGVASIINHQYIKLPELDESRMADIYIYLETNFPSHEDKVYIGAYQPNDRDRIQSLRDGLITRLNVSGTETAINQLDQLANMFPDKDWLKWSAHKAKNKFLTTTWLPPKVSILWNLLSNPLARQIRTDVDLMEAVISSLERFQKDLHGSPYMATFMWNELDKLPKGEARLSDFIKYHLNNDLNKSGILINREVEIRNMREFGVGERVDLLIQAITRKSHTLSESVVSVVIEVKRCSNSGLWTEMESQLKANYLNARERSCGIYLVGWYGEKQSCKGGRTTFSDLLNKLTKQAMEISEPGKQIKSFALDLSLAGFDNNDEV